MVELRRLQPAAAFEVNGRHAAARAERGLHRCPACRSKLVQPVHWERTASPGHWRLWRHCPNCGWESDGICDERQIEAFDDALHEGDEILTAELERCEREGMREVSALFSAALAADLITADDFRSL